eukprot:TRINITY_DN10918_c0_g1_i2.p1 TRINITY_DN10918_c0_g1~~TRINITY_DN10918_c0_g1_i2.p1  ORF type:complete len:306 (-),score=42.22 TRINITY_DN10918_c0_g1_i2:193-1038(-)
MARLSLQACCVLVSLALQGESRNLVALHSSGESFLASLEPEAVPSSSPNRTHAAAVVSTASNGSSSRTTTSNASLSNLRSNQAVEESTTLSNKSISSKKLDAAQEELHYNLIKWNTALGERWMQKPSKTKLVAPEGTSSFVIARDVPLYYDCGLVINTAWSEHYKRPCSSNAHVAADEMRRKADVCSQLREGPEYWKSIQALAEDTDRWCGGPSCRPACQEGARCLRSGECPYETFCEGGAAMPVPKLAYRTPKVMESAAMPSRKSLGWLAALVLGLPLCS